MGRAVVQSQRGPSKMHPVVHLIANFGALGLLAASLLSGHAVLAFGGISVFVLYCALESWSVARHRRDFLR